MNKLTLWFRKMSFLTGMVLNQSRELASLRKQIEHKNLCLQRSQTDYADARSFYEAQNKVLQERVNKLSAEVDKWYGKYLSLTELSPETEQDYIDQVIQAEVDRHDALEAQKG
jgi:hypothetical protein